MNFKLSNGTYDFLKWIATYALPGLGTLYFALAQIWGLPYGEQIVGTITALDTFLGVLLGISSVGYEKSKKDGDGELLIDTSDPSKDVYRLQLTNPVEVLKSQREVTFKVRTDAKL